MKCSEIWGRIDCRAVFWNLELIFELRRDLDPFGRRGREVVHARQRLGNVLVLELDHLHFEFEAQ